MACLSVDIFIVFNNNMSILTLYNIIGHYGTLSMGISYHNTSINILLKLLHSLLTALNCSLVDKRNLFVAFRLKNLMQVCRAIEMHCLSSSIAFLYVFPARRGVLCQIIVNRCIANFFGLCNVALYKFRQQRPLS